VVAGSEGDHLDREQMRSPTMHPLQQASTGVRMDEAKAEVLELVLGFQISQAVHVAAALDLADLLSAGPKTSTDIAVAAGAHPASLYRLMRALAAVGLFDEDEKGRFGLTVRGHALRTDVPGNCAPTAQFYAGPSAWSAWGNLLHAVRTGATAFDQVHGRSVWAYRAEHSEEAHVFDRAMGAGTARFAEALLAACDFGRFTTVVDIGGGDGTLLASIMAANVHIQATLFDQPQVVDRAAAAFDALGVSNRCELRSGDFFVGIPGGADAYLLKSILHDWDDAASAKILSACRAAMEPDSRLLIFEHVIGPPNTSARGKFMDLNMLVMTGGQERSLAEFTSLFKRSRFRLLSVTPTSTPLSVIEAMPEGLAD
jgi:O-methyltransferase domain/Dimerisation domain